jgi:hypothetical protein
MDSVPSLGLGGGAIIDGDRQSATFRQMTGHRESHYAKADPGGTNGHCTSPRGCCRGLVIDAAANDKCVSFHNPLDRPGQRGIMATTSRLAEKMR